VPSLLLINPNTSESVSALLHLHAQRIAGAAVQVHTVTARFGAPYIACEASYAVAGHAVLDAWAEASANRAAGFDAVLIGCFGDPALMALRECSATPVTGLAEAAFVEAAKTGQFAIVTGGVRWKPMLERLAQNLGFEALLAGIHTVEQSGAELARDPLAAQAILSKACATAAERFDAKSVIVGGAGLAGLAAVIQPMVTVPVIDSVEAGVRYALGRPNARQASNRTFDFAWKNCSPELTALGVQENDHDAQRNC
jgi:allantoin racemase